MEDRVAAIAREYRERPHRDTPPYATVPPPCRTVHAGATCGEFLAIHLDSECQRGPKRLIHKLAHESSTPPVDNSISIDATMVIC